MGMSKTAGASVAGLWIMLAVFSVATNALMLTGPLFMLQIYDRVLATRSEETLAALALLVGALFALYGVLEYVRGRVVAGVVSRRIADLVPAAFRGAFRGSDGSRAPDALSDLRSAGMPSVVLPLFDAPFVPLFLAAIFLFHPLLGLLATGGAVLLGLLAVANRAVSRGELDQAQAAEARADRHWRRALADAGFARAQALEGALSARWVALAGAAVGARDHGEGRSQSFAAAAKSLRFALQSGILALGAFLVLREAMTAGAMIAASVMFGRALQPVEQLISAWPVLLRGRRAIELLRSLAVGEAENTPRTALPKAEGRLSLSGVSVLPGPGATPVLHAVSLEVPAGQAVGVIGKSGAGKTSLAQIMAGASEPSVGEVRLDGALFEQIGGEARARAVGYLPQDVRFFDGTIAENIARMAPSFEDEDVVLAARRAGVHEKILSLADGYETSLGALNVLSGGEKQRLGLARALFGDPSLLVLDEPNAALDADGQAILNRVIAGVTSEGRTCIVMTHRPGAIAVCSRLVVLDRGQVKADGPRDRVLASVAANAAEIRSTLEKSA